MSLDILVIPQEKKKTLETNDRNFIVVESMSKRGRGPFLTVKFSNSEKLLCSRNFIADNHLYVGKQVTRSRFNKLQRDSIYDFTLQKALQFIDYKRRSVKEVRRKLFSAISIEKNFGIKSKKSLEEVISVIIDRLESQNLLNDQQLLEDYSKGLINKHKYSVLEIAQKATLKFGRSISTEEVFIGIDKNNYEVVTVKKLLRKKIKLGKLDELAQKNKEKILRYLLQKGFKSEQIKRAMDSFKEDR